MSERSARRKVLIVLHQAHSTPGRVGHLLTRAGVDLDIRRPSLDEPLPSTLADHLGVVVFGGPMSANDDAAWVKAEIDWLRVPLREGKPFLGLCLGAQMLAKHLGAAVSAHADRRYEAGYYPIAPTDDGDQLCGAPMPRHVYQWHAEGFEAPAGSQLLAYADGDFPLQGFRYGPAAVGLQFHPEVTYQMICRWTIRGAERLERPGARARAEHLEGWFIHDCEVKRWIGQFLPAWVQGRLAAAAKTPAEAFADAA